MRAGSHGFISNFPSHLLTRFSSLLRHKFSRENIFSANLTPNSDSQIHNPTDRVMGKEKEYMLSNGALLLEEQLSSCNGKCNPIRCFSAKQLQKATHNFQTPCYTNDYNWYRADLDLHRPVLIKTYRANSVAQACRDIAISSYMSSHNHVLKLLGCCLELPIPALVYEDAEHGPLNSYGGIGSNQSSFSWKIRLKIAKNIANSITFLHTGISRPIIHRNIKPQNVLLDRDLVPKLSDFSVSILIPEGQTQTEDIVIGTFGFLDPHYLSTQVVKEQTDVYSFGVFLLILLTGKTAFDQRRPGDYFMLDFLKQRSIDEIGDVKVLEEEEGIDGDKKKLQLEAFLKLAVWCIQIEVEDRPFMIDVAKELCRIQSL